MRKVRTLGLLGTGVIGGGWAARALHCGVDVIAADVDPKMEKRIRETVEIAMPQLQALTAGMPMPARGKLTFTLDPAEMAAKADFIQENVPESLELKLRVLEPISKVADPDVVISSSTSGFMPSELHTGLSNPERIIVGHPFNPVYLCPLVEVVGNSQTSPDAKEAAAEFYRSIGMHVLMLRREVSGHLTDRLQEAMWREILHALNDDIATTGELDESIVYGPGLRWAIMGMSQLYMLSGGEGGAEHFWKQFGPSVDWPWSHNTAPTLTQEIMDRFTKGTADQAAGRSVREQEMARDECLVAIQRVLAKYNMGAGKTLNEFEARMRVVTAG
ncbi:L-carnitine dehydrogenase [Mesorhizobium tianshanense]|uniref:Carnitine 3-dehydrogenase n=1 Tax=Mesorhizobium tianshanense TaxID=39844 RepID=A0A562N438_9HYPH|nr:3-hydroxyacyl-CoA dehydrogenase NAD-binding domain-containing protein [Mesorhizobium tianshanense]TWI26853.1 carnitine 3-dehydrogenase [Mesorhizobium tianshanense]GLS40309.1 L-carnitine dehydrogenase [Mesorhizobium tianshanense]